MGQLNYDGFDFLYSNTNLTIKKVAQVGSLGKGTANKRSDLDVIFCTSQDQPKNKIENELYLKLYENFNKTAKVEKGTGAIHIDYKNPLTKIDLVYLRQNEFDKEYKEIKNRKQIFPQQSDAIKIVKYAFDKVLNGSIKGYEVEKACILLNCATLNTCVRSIVNYFKGRLGENGFTVDNFLRKIINNL
ncbi:MAG: nucleotidyltransferase domain-containing protein [Candidatus Thorarchaeota archaeon]